MKYILTMLFVFSIGYSYGEENFKIISLNDVTLKIPTTWQVNRKKDCLYISKKHIEASAYLKVCKYISSEKSNFFFMNNDSIWEAVTEGIPVLAEINVTPKFIGMSAVVSCRINDRFGYHADQCFQAEINLPENRVFIFTGTGNSTLFKDYTDIYLSFKLK